MACQPMTEPRNDAQPIANAPRQRHAFAQPFLDRVDAGVARPARLPKEQLEVFGGGRAARLENFESVGFYGDTDLRRVKASRLDKGQGAQLNAFIEAVQRDAPMPIPLECLFDTTLTTLAVAQALGNTGFVDIRELWSRLEP